MRKQCGTVACLMAVLLAANLAGAFECTVCHSKNPKMVAMHKANKGKDCFGCHKIGEKLMGKGKPKDLASLLQRRVTETECLPCHGRKE
jgi:hypothetical protein